jgi:hypothetical protein
MCHTNKGPPASGQPGGGSHVSNSATNGGRSAGRKGVLLVNMEPLMQPTIASEVRGFAATGVMRQVPVAARH